MSDAVLASPTAPVEAQPARARPAFFGRNKQAIRAIGLVIVLLSVLVSSGSFLIMIGATGIAVEYGAHPVQQLQACHPVFTAKNVPELHQWLVENA